MEQPTNGLNASSAYDLACRYNNLFQYNQAAAAACAAAYGMFNPNISATKSQSVTSSPFQPIGAIATSSLPSSSSSPTSSLSSIASSSSKQIQDINKPKIINDDEKQVKGIYEIVSETGSLSEHSERDEESQPASPRSPLNENDNDEDLSVPEARSRARSRSSSSESSESLVNEENKEEDECEEVEMGKVQQKLSSDAEKSINSCLNQTSQEMEANNYEESSLSDDEDYHQDVSSGAPSRKICLSQTSNNDNSVHEPSLSSIMNSLKSRNENMILNDLNESKSLLKINKSDLAKLKTNLINAVNQAIENTLESFYDSKLSTNNNLIKNTTPSMPSSIIKNKTNSSPNQIQKKSNENSRIQQQPKRIRVNEKFTKNSINNSQNFNVSKILSTNPTIGSNLSNANKRKLTCLPSIKAEPLSTMPKQCVPSLHHSCSTPSHLNEASQYSAFTNQQKASTQSLINQSSNKSQHLSQFYSAAMSHLQHQQHHQQHSSSSTSTNFSYSHLINSNANPSHQPFLNTNQLSTHIPVGSSSTSSTSSNTSNILSSSSSSGSSVSGSSSAQSVSSLFAAHQHHQFLLAAAQAAAANGQSPNYLQMAAAANRLFTPYLLDQQQNGHLGHHHQTLLKPNLSIPSSNNSTSHLNLTSQTNQQLNFNNNANLFHSPHKRRRTKVTDTRLSPRNPIGLRAAGLLTAGQIGLINKNRGRDESPTNDNDDDQENLMSQDYEDEQQQNGTQDDDSASSACNDSGSTNGSGAGGQLATMPNGYGSGNTSSGYINEMNSVNGDNTPSEYVGYQISFFNQKYFFFNF